MTFIKLSGDLLTPPFVGPQDIPPTPVATSFLGNEVLDKLILLAPTIDDFDHSILEIYEVFISVHQPKNIIKTHLAGADGTVKEYIGLGDYQISLRGQLVSNRKDVRPDEDLHQLLQWLDYPDAFDVVSSFLTKFGIRRVVVESYNIAQNEGMRNVVPFRIEMVDDRGEELIIEEDVV